LVSWTKSKQQKSIQKNIIQQGRDKMPTEQFEYHCEDCGTGLEEDEININDYSDMIRCYSCNRDYLIEMEENEEEDEDESLIHNYGHHPQANFLSDDGTSSYYQPMQSEGRPVLMMGIEEEVESRKGNLTSGAEYVLNTINRRGEDVVYLKEDGSIYNGFEIVSHPATLGFFMNHFKWDGIKGLSKLGFESWNAKSCGLHIHMTRKAFANDKHLFKFLKFIYGNPTELIQFAGRNSTYAKFDVDTFLNSWNDYGERDSVRGSSFMKMAKHETINDDRYCAVNVRNVQTIELRFFRPSLKPETVQAALQFCDAAFNYTEEITTPQVMSGNALAFKSFRSWVKTQTDRYQILDDRITLRLGS
jgi:hypothetical protein